MSYLGQQYICHLIVSVILKDNYQLAKDFQQFKWHFVSNQIT